MLQNAQATELPKAELDPAYLLWWVQRVKESVEPVLEKPLPDSDIAAIASKVVACHQAGMKDEFGIFYSCLLELPDFQDERESITELLQKRLKSEPWSSDRGPSDRP